MRMDGLSYSQGACHKVSKREVAVTLVMAVMTPAATLAAKACLLRHPRPVGKTAKGHTFQKEEFPD